MLNPRLNFDVCLDHVKSGEGFIRGNGMNKILNNPEVRVRYRNFQDWVVAPGWRGDRLSPFVHTYAFSRLKSSS